jgi:superoxide reductase
MTKKLEIYRCKICGNIVEVLHEGAGQLVCCGQPMGLLKEKTEDMGNEKHVPVIEKTEKGVKVMVGSVPHPMLDEHFIEWIQILSENTVQRKFLRPGEKPEAEFETDEDVKAREYCNIHGLWKS